MVGFLNSLPELVDFKLFGKTILVVNNKFKLCFGQSTWEVSKPMQSKVLVE